MNRNKMENLKWEGAELEYYIDGESYSISLSDVQFAVIGKILGLRVNGEKVVCYSDETMKMFLEMERNPLRLKAVG